VRVTLSREFDLVLFGASGFTGRLVAEYLTAHAPPGVRWALAGRDREKLERIRSTRAPTTSIVVADAHDDDALDALAARARVVVSTVGPYSRHGTPLIRACIGRGTDACDITGEPDWIRDNVDRFHDAARESGARIVHCCGFDSIPSDLGVRLLHVTFGVRHATRLARARLYVRRVRGGISGGTAASMLDLLERAAGDRALRRLLADPYSLNPPGERSGPDGRDPQSARYDEDLGRWTAPFVMASINTRIVRRSNALLGYPYGRDFRYGESVLAAGRVRAALAAVGQAAFTAGAVFAPTRRLLRRVLPSPGQGPSRERREAGCFDILLRGHGEDPAAPPIDVVVAGDRDPGYGMTALMLAESALCLALDEPDSPGGVLTPAAAMGGPLTVRLGRAGMRLDPAGG